MIISIEKKYIFICTPKTGTTSIQQLLLKIDSTAHRNKLPNEGGLSDCETHITAAQIKSKLGPAFDDYYVFGGCREPLSRFHSLYHFYATGRAYRQTFVTKDGKRVPARVMLARLLPFWLWALFYPYKSNAYYLCDAVGTNLMTKLIRFEALNDDLNEVLAELGLQAEPNDLPHANRSKASEINLGSIPVIAPVMRWKARKDNAFY